MTWKLFGGYLLALVAMAPLRAVTWLLQFTIWLGTGTWPSRSE